jgi:hypothetical protein
VKEEGRKATKECRGFNGWMLREEGRWQKKDGRRKILLLGHSPTLALSRYHCEAGGEPVARQIVKK